MIVWKVVAFRNVTDENAYKAGYAGKLVIYQRRRVGDPEPRTLVVVGDRKTEIEHGNPLDVSGSDSFDVESNCEEGL